MPTEKSILTSGRLGVFSKVGDNRVNKFMRNSITIGIALTLLLGGIFFWVSEGLDLSTSSASDVGFPVIDGYIERPLTNAELLSELPGIQMPQEVTQKECVVTGCNNELCGDELITTSCEWKESYECYAQDYAICERRSDGLCDWREGVELNECISLAKKRDSMLPGDIVPLNTDAIQITEESDEEELNAQELNVQKPIIKDVGTDGSKSEELDPKEVITEGSSAEGQAVEKPSEEPSNIEESKIKISNTDLLGELDTIGGNLPQGNGEALKDCKVWFDGCNVCDVTNGSIGLCTEIGCEEDSFAYCME